MTFPVKPTSVTVFASYLNLLDRKSLGSFSFPSTYELSKWLLSAYVKARKVDPDYIPDMVRDGQNLTFTLSNTDSLILRCTSGQAAAAILAKYTETLSHYRRTARKAS